MDVVEVSTVAGAWQGKGTVATLASSLKDAVKQQPSLVIASYSSLCDAGELREELSTTFVGTPVMGGSTCRGAVTDAGLHGFGSPNIALWVLRDDEGDFGVGYAPFDTEMSDSVERAALAALEQAVEQADRAGELPDLIWIHASPGHEEKLVDVLDKELGGDVTIVGGSAADESLSAEWTCFAGLEGSATGIALAAFYTSCEVSSSFQCGYKPTSTVGVATRCEGRTVFEIDNRPAAEVYNQWAGGLIDLDQASFPASVLGSSTLMPLGMAVGDVAGVPYYNLAHPETYTEDLALTFFCEVGEGDTLTLMHGTTDNIISRPGRVANEAIHQPDAGDGEVVGGLVVFCGGCLLAVESRANEIGDYLQDSFGNAPFMGCFTFGEQGRFAGGENRHGNLMISVTALLR